ncbi:MULTISPECIES: ABC transporter permease [Citricoccus]|uniref:ABC transporter permease n=1 Tax=Citricoccus TaxID=169133 RepID=UPI00048F4BFE|nr:ABC transporter permease [Citricoccus sp. CH26A]
MSSATRALATDPALAAPPAGAGPSRRSRVKWGPLLLLLPAIAVVTMFFLVPLVDVFVRSVTDPEPGLQNYEWLLTNPVNLEVIARTFLTSLVVTFACLVVAYPYAYLMTIVGERARAWLTLFVMMPLWTSILVRTLAWMVLLADTGPINDFLEAIGVGRQPLIRTTFGVALGMAQVLLPFMVLPIYSALAKIDRRLLSASSSLGANGITTFFRVYLPLSRPGIFAGSITVFILGLGFYIIPSLLGSPKEAMVSSLIYQQVSVFLLWGQGAALGIALLVVTLIILVVFNRFVRGASLAPGVEPE